MSVCRTGPSLPSAAGAMDRQAVVNQCIGGRKGGEARGGGVRRQEEGDCRNLTQPVFSLVNPKHVED